MAAAVDVRFLTQVLAGDLNGLLKIRNGSQQPGGDKDRCGTSRVGGLEDLPSRHDRPRRLLRRAFLPQSQRH